MNNDFIQKFAHYLIIEAGLADLPFEYLTDYQLRLEQQISEHMGLIAIANLDDDGVKEYLLIIQEAKGDLSAAHYEKVIALWQKRIPNFQAVISKGMADFGNKFLENIKTKNKK